MLASIRKSWLNDCKTSFASYYNTLGPKNAELAQQIKAAEGEKDAYKQRANSHVLADHHSVW